MIYPSIYFIHLWKWTKSCLCPTFQMWKETQLKAYFRALPPLPWDYLRTLGWHSPRALERGVWLSILGRLHRDAHCQSSHGTQIVGRLWWQCSCFLSQSQHIGSSLPLQGHACGDLSPGIPSVPSDGLSPTGALCGTGCHLPTALFSGRQSSKIHLDGLKTQRRPPPSPLLKL